MTTKTRGLYCEFRCFFKNWKCVTLSLEVISKKGMLDITIFKAVGHDLLPTMKVPQKMSSNKSSWRRGRLSFIVGFWGTKYQTS